MEITSIDGKNKFNIYANIEDIINQIRSLQNEFEEEMYVWYGTSPEFREDDFKYISKDEYVRNVEKFENEFLSNVTEESLRNIIETWNRKKNGTFNKRNIRELTSCGNCIVIHEWHNTWIYYIVKVVAEDDYNLRIELYKKVDTPA